MTTLNMRTPKVSKSDETACDKKRGSEKPKHTCELCGGSYTQYNKKKHESTKRHQSMIEMKERMEMMNR